MEQERLAPKRMARKLARLLEAQHPDAHYVKKVFQCIRQQLALVGAKTTRRKLPELLTDAELKSLYGAFLEAGNPEHVILLKTLLYTGLRNAELVALEIRDVDLARLQLRVRSGKGDADRDVPIPESFRGELLQYLERQRDRSARYFLESRRKRPYTTRRIR